MRINIALVLNLVIAIMIGVRLGIVFGVLVGGLALIIWTYGRLGLSARVTFFALICELCIANAVFLLLGSR